MISVVTSGNYILKWNYWRRNSTHLKVKIYLVSLLITFLLVACSLTSQAKSNAPTATILLPTPTAKSEWTEIAPGLTTRKVRVETPYATLSDFDMVVVRVDPTLIQLKVHYEPTVFRTFPEWEEALDKPLAFINGSFFTPEGYAVGLVMTDRVVYGNSLEGFGGMLQVSADEVRVRSLVEEPYNNEIYEQVAQGFPMFIQPGGNPARTGEGFDDPSRRTIIAQETSGHILLMITDDGLMTLRNVIHWLSENPYFEVDVAFGLDGGKSTGLYFANNTMYPSIEPVPVVIAAYPR